MSHTHARNDGRNKPVRPIELSMIRTVNQHPMTAAQLLLAVGAVLHGPDEGRSVADPNSPRGMVLRALGYLATENRSGVLNELRGLDDAMSRWARAPAQPVGDTSPISAGPHVAYDAETFIVWGYGETLAMCQADAGWHVKEAGAGDQMATMRYVAAGTGMEAGLEAYGPSLTWTIVDGIAVPCQE